MCFQISPLHVCICLRHSGNDWKDSSRVLGIVDGLYAVECWIPLVRFSCVSEGLVIGHNGLLPLPAIYLLTAGLLGQPCPREDPLKPGAWGFGGGLRVRAGVPDLGGGSGPLGGGCLDNPRPGCCVDLAGRSDLALATAIPSSKPPTKQDTPAPARPTTAEQEPVWIDPSTPPQY